MRKRKVLHIPVLSGTPIPRSDNPEQSTKYAIIMLALFKPWNRSASCPLKPETVSWETALSTLLASLPGPKLKIIEHMQEQWECRLAADDFSADYKARLANFQVSASHRTSDGNDPSDDLANDLNWQLGQLDVDDEPIGPEYGGDLPEEDFAQYSESCAAKTQAATDAVIALTSAADFYRSIPTAPNNLHSLPTGHATESHDQQAQIRAQAATLLIAEEKAAALAKRAQRGELSYLHDVFSRFNYFPLIQTL
jgi:hypothetical protein